MASDCGKLWLWWSWGTGLTPAKLTDHPRPPYCQPWGKPIRCFCSLHIPNPSVACLSSTWLRLHWKQDVQGHSANSAAKTTGCIADKQMISRARGQNKNMCGGADSCHWGVNGMIPELAGWQCGFSMSSHTGILSQLWNRIKQQLKLFMFYVPQSSFKLSEKFQPVGIRPWRWRG